MWWAYGDVHSYAGKSLSRYALTRSAVGFGLERLPGQRRGPQNPQKTKPTSPQGVARDSGPITVDRWVPRLHPFMVVPRPMDGAQRGRWGRNATGQIGDLRRP